MALWASTGEAIPVFPRVRITAEDLTRKYRYHTLSSVYGVKLIAALPTNFLLSTLVHPRQQNVPLEALRCQIGPKTNPSWVTSQVAKELYKRRVIDGRMLDREME